MEYLKIGKLVAAYGLKGELILKHLLRGVKLGLFDDATAMEKFQKWYGEHEAQMKKRQEEALRARRGKRPQPFRRPERRSEGSSSTSE